MMTKLRLTAATLTILLYVAVGLYPYQFVRPSIGIVDNTAAFLPEGRLTFRPPGPGIARTDGPPPWLASAIAANHLDIVLRVRPAFSQQHGVARIMTISFDSRLRNLTVGQDGADLIFRLRTPQTDRNGTPPIQVAGVFEGAQWTDLVFSIRPHRLTIKVQGQIVREDELPAQPLANWDPSFRLALGNELNNNREWFGDIEVAQVSTPTMFIDYTSRGVLQIPRNIFISMPDPRLFPLRYLDMRDAVINVLGFMPLGFFLGLGRGNRKLFLLGLIVVVSTTLAIESLQFFTANRQPSVDDLLMNTLGGMLGWAAARGSVRSWIARKSRPGQAPAPVFDTK
ncbi:MAG: VanZ family protein [Hyphomicrobium sp.]